MLHEKKYSTDDVFDKLSQLRDYLPLLLTQEKRNEQGPKLPFISAGIKHLNALESNVDPQTKELYTKELYKKLTEENPVETFTVEQKAVLASIVANSEAMIMIIIGECGYLPPYKNKDEVNEMNQSKINEYYTTLDAILDAAKGDTKKLDKLGQNSFSWYLEKIKELTTRSAKPLITKIASFAAMCIRPFATIPSVRTLGDSLLSVREKMEAKKDRHAQKANTLFHARSLNAAVNAVKKDEKTQSPLEKVFHHHSQNKK